MNKIAGCILFCLSTLSWAASTVVVKPLAELTRPVQFSAPAEVVNADHAQIAARLSATVSVVNVQVGDKVSADQPLLQLECIDYELALQQAQGALSALQAQLQLARQQAERARQLYQQKNASQELRDQRQAELRSLQAQQQSVNAQLAAAELAVARCTIRAPFAGVVTARQSSVGDLVMPGTPLLRLLRSEGAEVEASLSADQVHSVQQATELVYRSGGESFAVQMRSVLPYVDPRARTQQVRLRFTEQPALTGSSGRITWQAAEQRLPVQYVVSRNGVQGLMSVQDGKALFVPLPDVIEGQAAAVNLPAQTPVIVEGQHGAVSGEAVELVE